MISLPVAVITVASVVLIQSASAKDNLYPAVANCERFLKTVSSVSDDNKKLTRTLDFFWSETMNEYPEWATYLGVAGGDDRWHDHSLSAHSQRPQLPVCQEKVLAKINAKKLSKTNKLTYTLLKKTIHESIFANQFGSEYLVLNQMEGIHMDIVDIMVAAPKNTITDYENRLKRLETFPAVINDVIALMEEGLKQKITPVKFLMEKVPAQIDKVVTKNSKESPIYKVFLDMPTTFDANQKKDLITKAEAVIAEKVNPSLETLKKFIIEKYTPGCRTDIAHSSLPKGPAWYDFLAQSHTTTHLTAKQIHELGLREVERIDKEMTNIRTQLKFKGSKADFHKFLQSDPQFYYTNPKDLIHQYQIISKQIDPALPSLFFQLPRLTYGVREMPIYKSADAPTAYYVPGSLQAGRPGYFEANTYNLKSRPKWEMEVLTVHEAVPGHHLQIALAQEQGELPEFRKHKFYTAFVEGWGLYSEALGEDIGLYKDLYSKYGQLVFQMWRAVRLVVDTGMHAMDWPKQKALDYFMEYIPKDRLQSENEIDRYITIPGQALAYKIGELKIMELKKRAAEKLHTKFDIREFHNEVLRHGAIPLDVLEDEINSWLSTKQKSKLN